ncbi:MAG: VWA domain-containing protein [Myxococcales bacterium]|nr:VWA domain-containing protein [Myxococcales bacterium]
MTRHGLAFGTSFLVALGFFACSGADDTGGGSGGAGSGGSGSSAGSGGLGLGGSGGLAIDGGGATGGGDAGVCDQAIDIVFSMDVSTSMGAFLNKLGDEIEAVDTAVKALNLKAQPHYGLVVFVDDTLFANSSQPYVDVKTLKADFKSWANFTSSNNQPSGGNQNTTWPENSLDSLYRAAKDFAWRPKASTLRLVIHTTDDTFVQGPTTFNGVQVMHNYADTVKALQEEQVRVFGFASKLGGPMESDDVSQGWFSTVAGSPAIPNATGGGVFQLDDVMSGTVSLSSAIPAAVKDTYCKPYPTPK